MPCRSKNLLRRPADIIGSPSQARHPNIPLPRDLLLPQRINSRGIEFGERAALNKLLAAIAAETVPAPGSVTDAAPAQAEAAVAAARAGFQGLGATPAPVAGCSSGKGRRSPGEPCAAHFIALLQREGGKTLDDALSEVREAADFCRYYAAEGRKLFGDGDAMPGPTGESNVLACAAAASSSRSRPGIFRSRSSWARSRRR